MGIIKRGRPRVGAEVKKRYSAMLEPSVAEAARRYGGGNLSAGIAKAIGVAVGAMPTRVAQRVGDDPFLDE